MVAIRMLIRCKPSLRRGWLRSLAELLQRAFPLRTITGLELIRGWHSLAPHVSLGRRVSLRGVSLRSVSLCVVPLRGASLRSHGAIDRSKCNLKFIDLIPFGFGTLSFGNSQKLLQANIGRTRLWFIHGIFNAMLY